MNPRPIRTVRRPLDATLRASPSKSATHRALVVASLADGRSVIRDPLDADDTRVTLDGLRELGVRVDETAGAWTVEGCADVPPGGGSLWLAQSGTSMRFLLALAALGRAPSSLDGSARLRERPLHDLAQALRDIGATVEATSTSGGLPARAGGGPRPSGGRVRVAARHSSQFASALLLVGSRLERGLDLTLEPPAVSLPYVDLTVGMLEAFGVPVERAGELRWRVPHCPHEARELRIEGDHSSASYFLAAAAVVGGRVRVEGLDPSSRQPDARLARLLADAGSTVRTGPDWIEVTGSGPPRAFSLDLGASPDLVPTVAVVAMFADGPCELHGISHLKVKESDRLRAVAANLGRLGCDAAAGEDRLRVEPDPKRYHGATVVTEGDHRMAMAFAVAGLVVDGVTVDDPACVSKSNPSFWAQLDSLG